MWLTQLVWLSSWNWFCEQACSLEPFGPVGPFVPSAMMAM
jgi:hypothetical protein